MISFFHTLVALLLCFFCSENLLAGIIANTDFAHKTSVFGGSLPVKKESLSLKGNSESLATYYVFSQMPLGIGLFGMRDDLAGEVDNIKNSLVTMAGGLGIKTWTETSFGRPFLSVKYILASWFQFRGENENVAFLSKDGVWSGYEIGIGDSVSFTPTLSLSLQINVSREKMTYSQVTASSGAISSVDFTLENKVIATVHGTSVGVGFSYKFM
jgi:hypothetical protein